MTSSAGGDTAGSSPRTVDSSSPSSRRHVVRVLIVAFLGFAALLGWSFASPIGASPDDNFHQVSIWCAPGERPGLCETTDNPDERSVLSVLANTSMCYAFQPEHNGNCEPALSGMTTTGHGNFIGMYPPVYYSVMSVFSTADVQTSILTMRVFNSFVAVALVTSIYLLVDRRLRTPMLWSLLLTAVPMGAFLLASVNPNGWAILSAATLWVAMVGFFRAPTRARQIALGALALIAAVMGAGSRGDSAAYAAFGAVVAAILSYERTRRYLLSLLVPLATIVMGAAFYLSSSQVGSALEGQMPGGPAHEVNFIPDFISTVLNIPQLWVGNFGSQALAWGDVKMPAIVWFTTLVLYAGIAFWSLSFKRDVRTTIVIVLAGIAMVMVPSWVITQNGVEVGVLVQPRYVLPLQALFIGLLLYGAGDLRVALRRVQRWILVIGLAAANSIALYLTMRRFLTGTDYAGFDLNKNIEWWWENMPVPPGVFWVIGSVAFAALLVLVTGVLSHRDDSAEFAPTTLAPASGEPAPSIR
ncbi:DUF2142 domain-containing protein [Microbacterium hydrocarbonoxydans]|uniref:DUF2142 domain-containing protein n=1 Tax=Microbacterium hydrocarbonoxydans TaxID=273678 RepID=UPI002041347A|nr:DUF2142 domain-containing protein [Microbacterium hydrocarbonoxydans]MCM3779311.1 DUF2142 domain-containing protein [Microbacterium hydrocarbonoxydans]